MGLSQTSVSISVTNNKAFYKETFGMIRSKGNIIAASSSVYSSWPRKLEVTCSKHDMVTSAANVVLSDTPIHKNSS